MESQISAYTSEPLPAEEEVNFDEQYDLVEASFIVAGFINVLFEWAKGNQCTAKCCNQILKIN